MPFIDFKAKKTVKVWEGITGTLHHSEKLTFGYFTIEKGALLPEHQHMHEQWTHLISGELEFTVNGETTLMKSGMAAFIPSNALHSARAITECKAIDCFWPIREDFVELEKNTK